MSETRSALTAVDEWFARVRADADRRRLAIVVGVVVGLSLAWFHWLGLVAGGALVGLPCRSAKRAALAGIAFGLLALVLTVTLASTVSPAAFLGTSRIAGVTVALTLVLSVWGALFRTVV